MINLIASLLILLGYGSWEGPVHASVPARRTATVQAAPWPSNMTRPPAAPSWARCPQWWDTARVVGWPEGVLGVLDGVMWHESNCKEWVTSGAGAAGLTQLMPMWWHGRNPYNAVNNLALALDLYRSEGGFCPAWRGDPAVGRC